MTKSFLSSIHHAWAVISKHIPIPEDQCLECESLISELDSESGEGPSDFHTHYEEVVMSETMERYIFDLYQTNSRPGAYFALNTYFGALEARKDANEDYHYFTNCAITTKEDYILTLLDYVDDELKSRNVVQEAQEKKNPDQQVTSQEEGPQVDIIEHINWWDMVSSPQPTSRLPNMVNQDSTNEDDAKLTNPVQNLDSKVTTILQDYKNLLERQRRLAQEREELIIHFAKSVVAWSHRNFTKPNVHDRASIAVYVAERNRRLKWMIPEYTHYRVLVKKIKKQDPWGRYQQLIESDQAAVGGSVAFTPLILL
ncbi:hypothetical protein G6F56_007917 [Rhizopus delemar]|nr:hypothetical protein G6F56_007917 [Rhizopus delemar]